MSSADITGMIDYVEEAFSHTPTGSADDWITLSRYFENSYPYTIDFCIYLGNSYNMGLLKGNNRKRLEALDKKALDIFGLNSDETASTAAGYERLEQSEIEEEVPEVVELSDEYIKS